MVNIGRGSAPTQMHASLRPYVLLSCIKKLFKSPAT